MQKRMWMALALALTACDDGAVQVEGDQGSSGADFAVDAGSMADAATDATMGDPDAMVGDPDAMVEPDARVDGRPAGWTEETHGKGVDYARVFPQDRVNRIDLRCTPENWASMQADLQALTGVDPVDVPDRPSGGGGGDVDFDTLIAACDGLMRGAECAVSGLGAGICEQDGPLLFCLPNDRGPEPDLAACFGKAEDDACDFEGYDEAVCLDVGGGQLGCVPTAWLGGGPGGPGGPGGDPDYAAAAFWPRSPEYIACDLEFEGHTWTRIGVRYKGNSTLAFSTGQTRKLPLRFKMDAFEDEYPEIDDQRFFGFNHLSTVNQFTDPSFIRQKMAADLFRAAGVPAPQTAFYRVYIDHGEGPTYFGLYTLTEVPRKPMLAAQFGDDDGNLYECDGRGAQFGTFVADSFHRKTNKRSDDYSDVEAFIDALNADLDPANWRMGLEARIDVPGVLRFFAMNQAMVNWDTYGALAHNYYVYGDPSEGGRLAFMPWDFDLSMQDGNTIDFADVDGDWPLITRLMGDEVYAAQYRDALAAVVEGPFAAETTIAETIRLRALIEPFVVGPDGEQPKYTALGSEEDFGGAHEQLQMHLRDRVQRVNAFLER